MLPHIKQLLWVIGLQIFQTNKIFSYVSSTISKTREITAAFKRIRAYRGHLSTKGEFGDEETRGDSEAVGLCAVTGICVGTEAGEIFGF